MVLPVLVVVGIVAAVLASYPWFVLSILGVLYLGSIPFSYRAQQRFAEMQPEFEETGGQVSEKTTGNSSAPGNKERL